MTISTIALSQQQSYQHTSAQNRKVTLLTPEKSLPNIKTNIQSQSSLVNEFSFLPTINTPAIPSDIEAVTYDKPTTPKLQLMALVLERFLGRQLDLTDFSFFTKNKNLKNELTFNDFSFLNQALSAATTAIVSIDGQSFRQGDLLSVEQWQNNKQQLNYQVQGDFIVNDQELSLSYNFTLANERTNYSKIEVSAATLKDPLIVQFGSQGLGAIVGQKDFAINQDDTVDSLPIFSGNVGYLVYDKNDNQQADDGSELFGPQTGNGFTELAKLDSNQNGFIDAEDQEFEQLYIWQPSANSSQAEQWLSLKDAKIQAISLSAINTPFDFYDQQGQLQAQLRQSSFAISDEGKGRGVHQVDVRI